MADKNASLQDDKEQVYFRCSLPRSPSPNNPNAFQTTRRPSTRSSMHQPSTVLEKRQTLTIHPRRLQHPRIPRAQLHLTKMHKSSPRPRSTFSLDLPRTRLGKCSRKKTSTSHLFN